MFFFISIHVADGINMNQGANTSHNEHHRNRKGVNLNRPRNVHIGRGDIDPVKHGNNFRMETITQEAKIEKHGDDESTDGHKASCPA